MSVARRKHSIAVSHTAPEDCVTLVLPLGVAGWGKPTKGSELCDWLLPRYMLAMQV